MAGPRITGTISELVDVTAFCADQAETLARDLQSGRGGGAARWLAVGLVIALQGACVCALLGYDTASEEDVLDAETVRALEAWRAGGGAATDKPREKIAPVALLLRRARSADYLAEPERLTLYARRMAALERLIDTRNAGVHISGSAGRPDPDTFAKDALTACDALAHLLLDHPAFAVDDLGAQLSLIGLALDRIRTALAAT